MGILFKEDRSIVKDEARPGRPVSATPENDVVTAQSIVQQDSRYTVEEISDLSGLSSSYVFTIPKEKIKATEDLCALDTPFAEGLVEKRTGTSAACWKL